MMTKTVYVNDIIDTNNDVCDDDNENVDDDDDNDMVHESRRC